MLKGFPFIFFVSLLFFWIPLAHSAKVQKLSIQGNKIVETSLILSHIHLKKGSSYSDKKAQEDVRRLYALELFDDIQVHKFSSAQGLRLVYKFKERRPIGKVEFKGHDKINTEDLKELSLVPENQFLNRSLLQDTLLAIKEKYREKGYYFVELSYTTTKNPDGKDWTLTIHIKENNKALIKRINFIGNRNIPSSELKAFMQTKEQNILSFLGLSGVFQPAYIERDLQVIEYYYRNKGYLNVRVKEPEITITPDKKFLNISFSIFEGPRFKVAKVSFSGDDVVSAEKVMGHLKLKEKEYFSLGDLQADIQLISRLYKDKGYAFVEVHPQFLPDNTEENHIHIFFEVNRGKTYRLGRIHISGNKESRDKVIFRRIHLEEGQLYNESQKELSRQLIQQLGYFEDVNFQIAPSEEEGELDLHIRVKERENTGEAQLAGGYNSYTKWFIQGGIKKQNFLGLDQNVALNLNFSKYEETFSLSYQNPYFLDSHWNFGFDLFNVSQNALRGANSSLFSSFSVDNISPYFQVNTGFSFSLGRQLSNFSSLFLKYRLQNQALSSENVYFLRDLPVLSSAFDFLFGRGGELEGDFPVFDDVYDLQEGSGLNSSLFGIFEYDTRNDRYYASKGLFTRLSTEYSGLGGDFDYTKLQTMFRHYYSPFWKLVIKNRLNYFLVFSNDKDKQVPFTELFLLGGPYSLRGFQVNTQGPRRYSQKAYDYAERQQQKLLEENPEEASSEDNIFEDPSAFAELIYGGRQLFLYSLELEFPIIERAELRGAFFFDIGEANDKLSFDLENQLRMNIGTGLRWKSPFGPISLELALPYKPRKKFNEKDWEFQFSMGSAF